MGRVIDVKCNQCGYSKRFFLGMGMRDWDKNIVIDNFVSPRAKEILDSDDGWCFSWELAKCEACKKLVRVPVLNCFNEENGKYRFIDGVCCGIPINEVIEVPEPADKLDISCPQCEMKLEVSENMLWD